LGDGEVWVWVWWGYFKSLVEENMMMMTSAEVGHQVESTKSNYLSIKK
jgi:hypothetical protein